MSAPETKVIEGVALIEHAPTPPHDAKVASNTTFVVDKARVNTDAAALSIVMVNGSVVHVPVLPLAAVVSTTKLLP